MPYLLIDIGNSYTKYASYDQNGLSPVICVKSTEFFACIDTGDLKTPVSLAGIVLVSVMGEALTDNIKSQLSQSFECSITQVTTSAMSLGVHCGYSDYSLLGADRWVAMIAVFNHAKNRRPAEPVLVVDCGTVITADVVTVDGQHIGGWMMPSLQLMGDTLGQKASGIQSGLKNLENNSELKEKLLIIGKSTRQCVFAGGKLAELGFIEQCFLQAEKLLGVAPLCILTGGGAKGIVPFLTMQAEYLPTLVLDGLALFIE